MKILVMSGTRDAFEIINTLKENPQLHITATTTTSYGWVSGYFTLEKNRKFIIPV